LSTSDNRYYVNFRIDAAYQVSLAKKKARIRWEEISDFIVIDRDILSQPSDQIKDVQVLKTFVEGEIVYEKR